MSVNLLKRQIANYNDPINIYNLSNTDIENQTIPFRTSKNIGKYIIFTDENTDGGYGQMDPLVNPYKGKKIINESADRNAPYINLSQEYVDVYVVTRGGRSRKNIRRRNRRRTRKHKKNYK